MTFEQKLYEQVCAVLPHTTTRSFSRDCGMSDNYLCSIQSQRLKISTPALIHLAEALEYRRTLGQTTKPIDGVLNSLADEIASRSNSVNSASLTVQRLIAKSIAAIAYKRDCTHNLTPITMGWM
jgi:hypothetical protein